MLIPLGTLKFDYLAEQYFADAVAIDRAAGGPGWDAERFGLNLTVKDVHGLVARVRRRPVGWAVWQTLGLQSRLHGLAVHPDYQRQGIGWILISGILNRPVITTVPDDALSMHLFLRSLGFTGELVHRRGKEDLIVFRYVPEGGCQR